jgi:LmbE family N-acetylglucosaminyl deacetylase
MRVLVVAPHADDEVLGAGGYMAKLANAGHEVFVLIMCDRSEGHSYDPQLIGFLRDCALKANAILGTKAVFFAHLREERLDTSLSDVIVPIEKHIAMIRPSLVMLPHRGDVNQDHRAVFEAGLVATRTLGNWEDKYTENELRGAASPYKQKEKTARRYNVQKVLCYEVPSTTEQAPPGWGFNPNVFVDITDTLEQKVRALACYTSETDAFPFPRSLEGMRVVARFRGMAASFEAAEAFELKREIVFTTNGSSTTKSKVKRKR